MLHYTVVHKPQSMKAVNQFWHIFPMINVSHYRIEYLEKFGQVSCLNFQKIHVLKYFTIPIELTAISEKVPLDV